jgi:hypothetical protein
MRAAFLHLGTGMAAQTGIALERGRVRVAARALVSSRITSASWASSYVTCSLMRASRVLVEIVVVEDVIEQRRS